MLNIEFNDAAKSGVKKKFVRQAAEETLKLSGYDFSGKEISISFAFLSEDEIKKLNQTYRHVDEATDVLSFSEYENPEEIGAAGDKLFLGEVIICYNFIKVSAHGGKLNLKQETARTISHAVLHLLGFAHGKKMFEIQDAAARVNPSS